MTTEVTVSRIEIFRVLLNFHAALAVLINTSYCQANTPAKVNDLSLFWSIFLSHEATRRRPVIGTSSGYEMSVHRTLKGRQPVMVT
jgi:hypothetical protein